MMMIEFQNKKPNKNDTSKFILNSSLKPQAKIDGHFKIY